MITHKLAEHVQNCCFSKLKESEEANQKVLSEFPPISNFIQNKEPLQKGKIQSSPSSSTASTPTNLDQGDTHPTFPFCNAPEDISSPIDILTLRKANHDISTAKQDINEMEENVDDSDEISFPDISASSMSTPTPPDEYLIKLQEAEVMIERLRNSNRHQRTEVRF